jgi:plastocyanin
MSSDPHGHDKEPIILTSGRRMGKGLAIVAVTLAIGAAILIPFFDAMFTNPPPVALIRAPQPPAGGEEEQPPQAGVTTITILQGAASEGAPDYDPDPAEIPLGNKMVWDNHDTVPHTATSGTGPDDPESAALFDTELIMGGEKSPEITLEGASEGDTLDYYCTFHPYMKGQLTIVAAGEGGAPAGGNGTATSGPTINILEGSATQGAPDFDPDPLEVTKGDKITVVNHDTTLHTVTNGKDSSDSTAGQLFDTGFLDPDATKEIDTATLDPGNYDYFCQVHPYMKGVLTVT